jgi:hypothetical protein
MRQESERDFTKFTLTSDEVDKFNNVFGSPNMITIFGKIYPPCNETKVELLSDKVIKTFRKRTREAGIKISKK